MRSKSMPSKLLSGTVRSVGWLSSNGSAPKGIARTCVAPLVAVALQFSTVTPAQATPVTVIETSLGFGKQTRLLRHLGLRFGDESSGNFMEAHFGPGEGGSLSEGFLKYGEGKVAQSEYLDTFDAGETSLSPQEAVDWCRKWADGRVFVSVGQNCWSMVHDFLEEHDGCYMNDSVKFKEENVNNVSKALISVLEDRAEKEDRSVEDVMTELMQDPKRLLPVIFTAETMKQYMPESLQSVVDKGMQMKDELQESMSDKEAEQFDASESIEDIAGRADDVKEAVKGSAE